MPSIPWWLAPCALTVSMSPNSHSNRSRSWIECSISTPEPARERSPRQVEAYIPWVGRYWSSRSTTCMTEPSAPSASRWRRATSAGVERRTSPTWLTQPGPWTSSATRRASSRSRPRGFSHSTATPASAAAPTPSRCAAVQVATTSASQAAATASAESSTWAPCSAANASGAQPVRVVHGDDPVRFLGQRELQRVRAGDEPGAQDTDAQRRATTARRYPSLQRPSRHRAATFAPWTDGSTR